MFHRVSHKLTFPYIEVYYEHQNFWYLQERARSQAPGNVNDLSVIEGQIAWLVHIIAAILKIRQTTGCRYVKIFSSVSISDYCA